MNDVLLARNRLDIGCETHLRLRRGETLHNIEVHEKWKGLDPVVEVQSLIDIEENPQSIEEYHYSTKWILCLPQN